jgi:hypothetical protein
MCYRISGNQGANRRPGKPVGAGSKLDDEANSTTSLIVWSVKPVADIVGKIDATAESLRTDIEQANQAFIQMDQVTQKNGARVEEASAAAQAMADQSQALQEAVASFRIDGTASSTLPNLWGASGASCAPRQLRRLRSDSPYSRYWQCIRSGQQ